MVNFTKVVVASAAATAAAAAVINNNGHVNAEANNGLAAGGAVLPQADANPALPSYGAPPPTSSTSQQRIQLQYLHGRQDVAVPTYHANVVGGVAEFFEKNDYLKDVKPEELQQALSSIKNYVIPDALKKGDYRQVARELCAHRGLIDFGKGIPENSLAAFKNVMDTGLKCVEFDVQQSLAKPGAYGEPIAFHDASLGRVTCDSANRLVLDVPVDELTKMEIKWMDPHTGECYQTGEKIPTLQDSLNQFFKSDNPEHSGMSVILDCKDTNGEAVLDVLLRPENAGMRESVAIKIYAQAYPGGFAQFLANYYTKKGISPSDPAQQGQRLEVLESLKEIKFVPVFSESVLDSADVAEYFPTADADPIEAKAEMALHWIQSWNGVAKAVSPDKSLIPMIEANPMRKVGEGSPPAVEADITPNDRAMSRLNVLFTEQASGLNRAGISASSRYPDFSVPKGDGTYKNFVYDNFGQLKEKSNTGIDAQRATVGGMHWAGNSALTDMAVEEAVLMKGYISDSTPRNGAAITKNTGEIVEKNAEICQQRAGEYKKKMGELMSPKEVVLGASAALTSDLEALAERSKPEMPETPPETVPDMESEGHGNLLYAQAAILASAAVAMAYMCSPSVRRGVGGMVSSLTTRTNTAPDDVEMQNLTGQHQD